jgi:alpha-1,3-rhamnosyltransferase
VEYTFIEQTNTGNVARNANLALQKACGEIIVFMSLDDLLLPNCISSKMTYLGNNPSACAVVNGYHSVIDCAGRVTSVKNELPILEFKGRAASELKELEYNSLGSYFLQGSAFRRELLHAVGGFDEDIPGDDLVLRTKIWDYLIAHPEERMHVQPFVGFAYRKHNAGMHKDVCRQVLTVLAWRDRFFPSHPLPKQAQVWLSRMLTHLEERDDPVFLSEALAKHPQLSDEYEKYKHSWTRLRRRAKGQLRKKLTEESKYE